MLRALNAAATGMAAQQLNIDVVANNMANVNTTGCARSPRRRCTCRAR
jgi:flagellar basal-body rod protein FlgG